jgi:hypothetical protein
MCYSFDVTDFFFQRLVLLMQILMLMVTSLCTHHIAATPDDANLVILPPKPSQATEQSGASLGDVLMLNIDIFLFPVHEIRRMIF